MDTLLKAVLELLGFWLVLDESSNGYRQHGHHNGDICALEDREGIELLVWSNYEMVLVTGVPYFAPDLCHDTIIRPPPHSSMGGMIFA